MRLNPEVWREEAALIPEFYQKFGEHTPKGLWEEYEALVKRLEGTKSPQVVAAE